MVTIVKLAVLDKDGRNITDQIPTVKAAEQAMERLYASLMADESVAIIVGSTSN